MTHKAVCSIKVLELDELPREFTNYGNHTALDDTKTRMLLDFCNLLSPSLLEGKCIFEVDYDLDGSPNKFLELSNTETTMVATSSVMMGGRNVQVLRVMLYRPTWRRNYYDQPLAQLTRSLEKKSSGCVIMWILFRVVTFILITK